MDKQWTEVVFIFLVTYLRSVDTGVSMKDFIQVNIDGQDYILSIKTKSTTDATAGCSQMYGQVALFETNQEYNTVAANLYSFFDRTVECVWINFVATKQASTLKYDFFWNNEPFNNNLWAPNEPNANCQAYDNTSLCCAHMVWNGASYEGLDDAANQYCNEKCYYLCKPQDACVYGNPACEQMCQSKPWGFDCKCVTGYQLAGDDISCDDIDECAMDPPPCEQNCTNEPGYYTCSCQEGYVVGDDNSTCVDVDECSQSKAPCAQICVNTNGSYTCQCNDGFVLSDDQMSCQDFNECAQNTSPCSDICVNTNGSYICQCSDGFVLLYDKISCQDTDECTQNTSTCSDICVNTNGSYICQCSDGFVLSEDQMSCHDVNECAQNTSTCSDICVNTNGSYTCQCSDGFVLSEDQVSCHDVDECTLNTSLCTDICVNTNGSYICQCKDGYAIAGDQKSCEEAVNEFAQTSSPCSGACINTTGSLQTCADGFQYVQGACEDVNECSLGIHNCSQICLNTEGSYNCTCAEGYIVSPNDLSVCDDIDECVQNTSLCTDICVNTNGSYICQCKDGYALAGDQKSCEKAVMELAQTPSPCSGECVNTTGSLQTCADGFQYVQGACEDVNECSLGKYNCSQNCLNTDGGYNCTCAEGYIVSPNDLSVCDDIDECAENTSLCTDICVNTNGSYTCECNDGFVLAGNMQSCEKETVNTLMQTPSVCSGECVSTTGILQECGLGLQYVQGACVDVNECTLGIHNCSQICLNTVGGYDCTCAEGYSVSSKDISTCEDIDECQKGLHNCNSSCENIPGAYICGCPIGYILDLKDGATCQDIDECQYEPCDPDKCVNTIGSFFCNCSTGFGMCNNGTCCKRESAKKKCPCSCSLIKSPTDIQGEVKKIKNHLRTFRDYLSSYRRRRTSVMDWRLSAQALGYSGILIIFALFGSIVLLDALKILRTGGFRFAPRCFERNRPNHPRELPFL